MIRKEGPGDRGRRPLLLGANRQMLETIRDSLSHVRTGNQQEQFMGRSDQAQLRPELSHSTPNLVEKVDRNNSGNGNKMTRIGYTQKALAEIRNSLKPFKNQDEAGFDVTRQDLELSPIARQTVQELLALGYDADLAIRAARLCGDNGTYAAMDLIQQQYTAEGKNGVRVKSPVNQGFSGYHGTKVIRKPSFEEKYRQNSPVSDNASVRSESPSIQPRINGSDPPRVNITAVEHGPGHYASSSTPNGRASTPPPPIPPRTHHPPQTPPRGQTPPPPPPLMHPDARYINRHTSPIPKEGMGTLQQQPGSGPVTPQRGVSPVSFQRQPVIMQNQQNGGIGTSSKSGRITVKYSKPPPPLPPYPQRSSPSVVCNSPTVGIGQQSRSEQSTPTYDCGYDIQGMRSASGSALGSPSPVNQVSINLSPMQAWGAKQAPIVMQSVHSREVQRPIAQTATVPMAPLRPNSTTPLSSPSPQSTTPTSFTTSLHTQIGTTTQTPSTTTQAPLRNVQIHISHGHNILPSPPTVGQPPGRTVQININKNPQNQIANFGNPADLPHSAAVPPHSLNLDVTNTISGLNSPCLRATNQSPVSITSTISTPSTNSDNIPDKPPPPYPGRKAPAPPPPDSDTDPELPPPLPSPLHRNGPGSDNESVPDDCEDMNVEKHRCTSPIPERTPEAKWKDEERREFKVKNYSPQAFKFYMEQHMENVLKSHQQRLNRRIQLENEMAKVGLSEEAQCQMRKMLHQKESNYIRLKRAKMDKAMFESISTLGVGAFGKVALVRKRDTGHLYAMKTLRKSDVLKRNQVAHVKAERDILAEADNEWVVKLYYSFQDTENLYFVMDYIPGGDMMSLLIKFGIFQEQLARFYVAELVLAIESVHKMGFIHRDIKPDNILIDRDGHIKLTDFGLCTGFRWTHNSKVYQKDGHARQDSMDPNEVWGDEELKPLERRKQQEQRYLAHSLVGTPNYIAPEVLLRLGYSACCDWWSVGVILYEMLVGHPPFLASSPAETQYKVIQWEQCLHIPMESNLSSSAKDLILRLCRGPDDRLGRNGSTEVKSHRFFQDGDINFEGLRRQQAPYSPVIKYPTDTSNFDAVEMHNSGSEPDDLKPKDLTWKNGKHLEHAFFEFTFRRFFDEGGHPYATKLHDPETDAPVYV